MTSSKPITGSGYLVQGRGIGDQYSTNKKLWLTTYWGQDLHNRKANHHAPLLLSLKDAMAGIAEARKEYPKGDYRIIFVEYQVVKGSLRRTI